MGSGFLLDIRLWNHLPGCRLVERMDCQTAIIQSTGTCERRKIALVMGEIHEFIGKTRRDLAQRIEEGLFILENTSLTDVRRTTNDADSHRFFLLRFYLRFLAKCVACLRPPSIKFIHRIHHLRLARTVLRYFILIQESRLLSKPFHRSRKRGIGSESERTGDNALDSRGHQPPRNKASYDAELTF